MTSPYTQQVIRVVIGQICQTIGWNSVNTTPLGLMVDFMHRFLQEVARQTARYAELYGRIEPNLDDVALAFRDMNINISDLEEYITYVDPVPCAIDVPRYPLPKDSNLNFLKPGLKECVTRPVHIDDHLPPIHPELEDYPEVEEKKFKQPTDYITDDSVSIKTEQVSTQIKEEPPLIISPFKRPRDRSDRPELEGRPTREISSVIMTTSGFISPAREGKLPGSMAPIVPVEPRPPKPPIQPTPVVVPTVPNPVEPSTGKDSSTKTTGTEKRIKKKLPADRVVGKSDRKKDRIKRDLLKSLSAGKPTTEPTTKPIGTMILSPPTALPPGDLLQPSVTTSVTSTTNASPIPPPPLAYSNKLIGDLLAAKDSMGIPPLSVGRPPFLTTGDRRKPVQQKPERKRKKKDLLKASGPGEGKLKKPKMSKAMKEAMKVANTKAKAVALLPNDKPMGVQYPPPVTYPQPPPLLPQPSTTRVTDYELLRQQILLQNPTKLPNFNDNFPSKIPPQVAPHSTDNWLPIIGSQMPPPPDVIGPMKSIVDGKLSTEPDKQKLNIFKRISKPTTTTAGSNLLTNRVLDPTDLPEKSNSSWPPNRMMGIGTGDVPSGNEPLNMSLQKPLDLRPITQPHQHQFPMPTGPHFPFDMMGMGPMKKPVKERKPKEVRIPKKPRLPKEPKIFKKSKAAEQSAAAVVAAAASANTNIFQNLFPAGMWPLGPYGMGPSPAQAAAFSSVFIPRPGLIPHNPYFNFSAAPPFMMFPRLRRPGLDAIDELSGPTPSTAVPIERPQCNVAPLLPESMRDNLLAQPEPVPFVPNEPKSADKTEELKAMAKAQLPASTTMTAVVDFGRKSPGPVLTQVPIIDNEASAIVEIPDSDDELPPPLLPKELIPEPVLPQVVPEPPAGPSKFDRRKEKLHRKKLKEKEGRIKKKKDKRDKGKIKERRMKEKLVKYKDKESRERAKKERREKKKEEKRAAAQLPDGELNRTDSVPIVPVEGDTDGDLTGGSLPKIVMKIAGSPRPDTPDSHRKITIKQVVRRDFDSPDERDAKEGSPELARISALITRPKKHKNVPGANQAIAITIPSTVNTPVPEGTKLSSPGGITSHPYPQSFERPTAPTRGRPKGSTAAACAAAAAARAAAAKQSTVLGGEEIVRSSPTPTGPLGVSGGITTTPGTVPSIHQKSPSKLTALPLTAMSVRDSEGNEVWICPACGRVDDGTPMIGCDGCDAWYHWVCVGIQVPPDQNEDWYCRVCIAKKQECQHSGDKKKKRKKREKRDG